MALKFTEHKITCDNLVLTNKLPAETNKITTLLGANIVSVGVANQNKQVIRKDPNSGLNYMTNDVEAQQVYNLSAQRRGCWFALDLETGRGGKSWYPGSKQVAATVGEAVEIKEQANDQSSTLLTISNTDVDIKDQEKDSLGVVWYKVSYVNTEGYVKNGSLSNFRFVDRED